MQEILYLSALTALKKGKPPEEVLQLLQETMESHFSAIAVNNYCSFLN